MKKHQTLFAVILTILSLAFIVFVTIMQQKFANPEFTDLPTVEIETTRENNDEVIDEDTGSVAGAAGSVVSDFDTDEKTKEEATDNEVIHSTRTVIAETLNVRNGPGADFELEGLLEEGQVVEVEDRGDDWVKVITDEFTGYVNKKFLSEE